MPTPRIPWIPAVALALLASPALAGSPCTDPPIPRFGPLAEEPEIVYLPPAGIRRICDARNAFRYIFACADEVTNTVYLTDTASLREQGWTQTHIDCLMEHELAHLWHEDGTRWPGTHEGFVTR